MSENIRIAKKEDFQYIKEISMRTWDGEDYLDEVFEDWLHDGNFYVLEIDETVVGAVKISILPCRVGWMEGLRVHPDYQNHGFGTMLHNFILDTGQKLKKAGKIVALEFATHIFNQKSISLARNDDFVNVERFYYLYKKPEDAIDFEMAEIHNLSELEHREYIPIGWRFIHKSESSIKWMNTHGVIGKLGKAKFTVPAGGREPVFSPIRKDANIKSIASGASLMAKKIGKKYVAMMLPETWVDAVAIARNAGFENMLEFNQGDVLIFRKDI